MVLYLIGVKMVHGIVVIMEELTDILVLIVVVLLLGQFIMVDLSI